MCVVCTKRKDRAKALQIDINSSKHTIQQQTRYVQHEESQGLSFGPVRSTQAHQITSL